VDLISAKLSQAAPEASDKWKEQPANAIERWKVKNLATANKEAADKTSWGGRQENRSGGRVVDTELRRRSRSRSRERMRNKDLAMAGAGSGGVSSAFGRSSAAGGVLPTPVFGQRTASKFDAPASSFNPFDRSEAGGGGFGGRSQLGGSGLLPFPEDGDSISGSRFSAGNDGGISFRAPNPFDNRGFSGSSSSALDNLSQRPGPFDAFSSPSGGGGGSGGFGAGGVTFGGGMNPFDNRGGDSGGGGNPFDRRRSRFDEPPAQIPRPGVWNENDQVRAMCIW
jgi:hypothetical protein